ncbi:nuclear transport factor 2 family protein [Flavobacterium aquariorum]|uniref:Nuclear transport factor 2 family protein n=1 Tax=Flavobacterium aquariorum TaxID=2217670 RepID=A0A2W7U0U7_9FLAO|nr:nuclear transport factor 2 family protein [Flavobacterium aquariorum]PZX95384.1 nuclear transport factor 2 family protein [Flavobacterium aquariorum]
MKKLFSKALVVSSVLLLLISCKKEEPVTATIDINQIKKEIQAKENEFADTYNTGVVKEIGYFADGAITFPQNNQPVIGKEAIIEYLKSHVDSISKGRKISFTTTEVFPSKDGEQVVEIGYYKVLDSTNTVVNSGNYMTLFVKKDGKYYSLRDMSTSDLPN